MNVFVDIKTHRMFLLSILIGGKKKLTMVRVSKDRRHGRRDTFITTVNYTVSTASDSLKKDTLKQAITINLSPTGVCLYVFNRVAEGQRLELFASFFSESCSTAVVRWVKKITDDIYKVGLMCS